MNEKTNEQMNECSSEQMNEWSYLSVNTGIEVYMNEKTYVLYDVYLNGENDIALLPFPVGDGEVRFGKAVPGFSPCGGPGTGKLRNRNRV